MSRTPAQSDSSRRDFLKTSAAAVAGAALAAKIATRAYAAGDDVLKVGLIGCGGRGGGAANQALNADKNVKLVALADAFKDRLEGTLSNLKKAKPDKVAVDDDHKFVGIDGYKKLVESGVDVVVMASPPHFRPAHLKAAIDAGKHVFAEKPVAVDGPGVRSVIASCKLAEEKKLSVVSGLCWRYDKPKAETLKRVQDGALGEMQVMQCTYNTGFLWSRPRQKDWSDMEFQMRNWLYYTWLSGDHIVEQHIHSLDKAPWAMKDEYPIKCTANGGRQVRTDELFGNIYDHFNCVFEWKNGAKCFSSCRQINGCSPDVSDHFYGTKGVCHVFAHEITGENKWKYAPDGSEKDMYQAEHDALFASIRSGKPINNGDYMAKSTLMAIMGRMCAYTGQTLTWDQVLNSQEDLSPAKYEWGTLPMPPVPMPGLTKFK
ncbi:MAG TPA: Gfo/Idh/MocA family oxidoreductase [Planctomycetota bacterium]|jgi:predicted dehydrogenase